MHPASSRHRGAQPDMMALEQTIDPITAEPGDGVVPGGGVPGGAVPDSGAVATRKHIRGSTLLLVGRLLSLALNFGVQVLTVRYLAKSDYGAFAYALSIVAMGASISLFGLDKAVARFLPIYEERNEEGKVLGTIVMTLLSILLIGAALILLVLGLRGFLQARFIQDPLAVSLLVVVILLAPVQALDSWFQGLFAVFAEPRAIFVRRYLLGPGFKLAAVLLVIVSRQDVHALALGYLAGGVLGVLAYVGMLRRLFRARGIRVRSTISRIVFPLREVFSFSTPLLTSDAVNILKTTFVVILLEYFASTTQVAEFRAVVPVAGLNLVVMQSFKYLFTPAAARLYAHDDSQGINELYWRTATWIAVFTFPVFAASFSLARPLTVLLFEERYASSASILALLALGNYWNAAFGFNAYTLRVFGKVRFIVAIDLLSGLLTVLLGLFLIPRHGAIGAAIATSAALIIYNLLNHAGLLLGTNIDLFQGRYVRVYASIVVTAAVLFAADQLFDPGIVLGGALIALLSLLLLAINWQVMDATRMFPELGRLPIVGPHLVLQEKQS